jgi:hypothetical protein
MASLRRNKTLSPDGQTARFLYTIIKQLDLKAIDWNLVAGSLEITNGHAARMRYSRFKQHMEGQTTQPRAPRAGKKEKEGKEGKEGLKKGKKRILEEDVDHVRGETAPYLKNETRPDGEGARVKRECSGIHIKNEHGVPYTTSSAVHIKSEPGLHQDEQTAVAEAIPTIRVKREPGLAIKDSTSNPDIWKILPRAHQISFHDQTPNTTPVSALPLTTQAPSPRHVSDINLHQSTVSLAELEVSPRTRPSAVPATNPALDPVSFPSGNLSAQRKVPSAAAYAEIVHIKDEPQSDLEWMISAPSAGVMVKSEPMDM